MISDYQLLDCICATSGSYLYRAKNVRDGTPVALKLLEKNRNTQQTARFRREYDLLRMLDISGVVKPHAFVDARDHQAMVLSDLAGQSLDALLRHGRLDVPTCLRVACKLADILAGLHAAQVIHQDIRPVNFLLTPEQQVYLLDVSMAGTSTQQFTLEPQSSIKDWAYVSPEQTGRTSLPLDYRTDFYSLGIVLYRMFTGHLPFAAADPLEWTHRHIAHAPPPMQSIVPDLPQAVSDIVMKLLAKLPENRYQSARGVHHDLENCLLQWQASGRIDPFAPGVEDFSERFQMPDQLYGREHEKSLLLNAFDRMAASGQRALAVVTGPAGAGKSSLVRGLEPLLLDRQAYFITGKFDQYIHDTPYATIAQAFRSLVRLLLAESDVRIADWRQRIQQAVGINGRLILDVLPQLELVIGPQPPVGDLPPMEAQNRFRRVFQQFLGVFTRKEHPLVLFLDDMQWIDAASRQLIDYLFSDTAPCYLLLIAAYRDADVSAAHPLMSSLRAIRQSNTIITEIALSPLPVATLNQLVADTLYMQTAQCAPLTQLIFEKTAGNPFFFTQFLLSLYKEHLLRYDAQGKGWRWNQEHIKAKNFADNIAGLMIDKLRRLPASVQDMLRLAACLGNTFDMRNLVLASRLPRQEVEHALKTALDEGMIIRSDGTIRFLHDRMQQAAYSLISEEDRGAMHLRIGRALLENADALEEQLFDVANQFNRSTALLVDQAEKEKVAEINLRAGRKAKASAAYASACIYLSAGMSLLDDGAWEHRYPLVFGLWFERANCELMSGNLGEAERYITILLQRASSRTDQAAVYGLKILFHVMRSENQQAIDGGVACLRLFGIDLPVRPTQEQIQAEYNMVWRNLEGRTIESLIDLPLTCAPDMQAVIKIFSSLIPPAIFSNMDFSRLLLSRGLNLTLKHGVSEGTAHCYACFGLVPELYDRRTGFRFVQLAAELTEKHRFLHNKANVHLILALAASWVQPFSAVNDHLRNALLIAAETGNVAIDCYGRLSQVENMLLCGIPLDEVLRESATNLEIVHKAGFRDISDTMVSHQRFVLAMQGKTVALSRFSDARFDEAAFEEGLVRDGMSEMRYLHWSLKLQAGFLAGDYAAALAAADKAKMDLRSSFYLLSTLNYHYYDALALAAVHDTAMPEQQRTWRASMAAHEKQLREWVETCHAPTFLDKHALVLAEIARLDGKDKDAMRLYEQAIASASENDFVENEGIAHELAARFYLSRGSTTAAKAHLDKARACFARWGANGKVAQLETVYPDLLAQPASAPAMERDEQLDLRSITKASQAISGQILLDELVDTLMQTVLENAGAQSGVLLLIRGDELELAANVRIEEQRVRVWRSPRPAQAASLLPASILNYVRRSKEKVLVADTRQAHLFSGDEYFVRHHPKSLLCLPILRRDVLLGVLYLENGLVTHAFTPARLTVLDVLAAQAAISLENALLYADLHEREARIRRLVESNIIGVMFWDADGRIRDANEAFLHRFGYTRQDVACGKVRWTDMTPPEYADSEADKAEEIRRTGSFSRYEKEFLCKDGTRVPVLIGAALLEGSRDEGVAFVLDLTEQKQAEARIRYMAHYDALTGLPNRLLLQDRIKQAISYADRHRMQLAILFIDIDHFKHINDSLGHSVGDRLLQMIGERLRQCLREEDSVGRLGGDEFILSVLLESAHAATLVAQKVLDALHPAFEIEGHALNVNGSIGISMYPSDGVDADGLMRAADTAMYHAKEKGRGTYRFFTPALDKATQHRLDITNRLAQALARDEFVLHFQPQVNMETGEIFGAEALLRWQPPGNDPVSCGEIIPIAEETGLILPIGERVLHQACCQLRQWRDAGHPQLQIAVNLSPRQFYQRDLPDMVGRILNDTGLPASALELEITEGLVLQGNEDNIAVLHGLCDLGISLSMDDFGTGYSSLSYLQRFPIHKLKIDQSFVRGIGHDENDSALVAAIIAMAHGLHLNVLSEGVETAQQVTFLLAHGCFAAQGFYYSRAVPAEAFTDLLNGRVFAAQ
jgi:diguanylate cyclase (GGDEF)-like protein/PAS domain S-box-containing protein